MVYQFRRNSSHYLEVLADDILLRTIKDPAPDISLVPGTSAIQITHSDSAYPLVIRTAGNSIILPGESVATLLTEAAIAGMSLETVRDTIAVTLIRDTGVFTPADMYALLGSSIKFEAITSSILRITTGAALTDNTVQFVLAFNPRRCQVSGFGFYLHTAGNFTADQYNGGGVYKLNSGTTFGKVAESDNDAAGNLWKSTALTVNQKAFNTSPVLDRGLYLIAWMYNNSAQTTAPQIGVEASVWTGVHNPAIFGGLKLSGNVPAQNSLPATIDVSTATILLTRPAAYIY